VRMPPISPMSWYGGSQMTVRSAAVCAKERRICSRFASRLAWRSITPLLAAELLMWMKGIAPLPSPLFQLRPFGRPPDHPGAARHLLVETGEHGFGGEDRFRSRALLDRFETRRRAARPRRIGGDGHRAGIEAAEEGGD